MSPANTPLTPEDQADESDLILAPGERPFAIPWCASCKDTVEMFTWDLFTSPFRIGLQAQCHGKTEGVWIRHEDLLARKRDGKPIVVFKRGNFDRVR